MFHQSLIRFMLAAAIAIPVTAALSGKSAEASVKIIVRSAPVVVRESEPQYDQEQQMRLESLERRARLEREFLKARCEPVHSDRRYFGDHRLVEYYPASRQHVMRYQVMRTPVRHVIVRTVTRGNAVERETVRPL